MATQQQQSNDNNDNNSTSRQTGIINLEGAKNTNIDDDLRAILEDSIGSDISAQFDDDEVETEPFRNVFLSEDDDDDDDENLDDDDEVAVVLPAWLPVEVPRPPAYAEPVLHLNDNDVCFRKINHPGTKRWREVVNMFTDRNWSLQVFCLIIQQLANDYNITRFLFFLNNVGTPVKIGSSQGHWYLADRDEIIENTHNRFIESRKKRYAEAHPGTRRNGIRPRNGRPNQRASVPEAAPQLLPSLPTIDPFTHFHDTLAGLQRRRHDLEQEAQQRPQDALRSALQHIEAQLESLRNWIHTLQPQEERLLIQPMEIENSENMSETEPFSWRRQIFTPIGVWAQRSHGTIHLTNFKLILIVTIQIVVALIAILLGVLLPKKYKSSSSNTSDVKRNPMSNVQPARSTLELIQSKGYLDCGVVPFTGLSMQDTSTGEWSGFEVDLCRAIGVAIFDEDGHVRFSPTTYSERFTLLQKGAVDVLAGTTLTMERDVYEPTAKAGFTFSVPYFYDGLSFAGKPDYVACADQKSTSGRCSSLRICVQNGTTHVSVVEDLFPNSSVIVVAPTLVDFYDNFVSRHCSVLAGKQFDLAKNNVVQAGYSDDYAFSLNQYSKEPLALVTRDGDSEWSDLVNWVLMGLLTAEVKAITQQMAQEVIANPGPAVDWSQLSFFRAVATVGNYGEMYSRYLDGIVPRALVNQQNNGTTPLQFALPFGNASAIGPGLVSGGTLERILQRGYLVCGILDNPFFYKRDNTTTESEGFGVAYCRAVAAAILNGMEETVFVHANRWEQLAEQLATGAVDLISLSSWTYEREAQNRFSFSSPIFHTGLQFGGIPPFVRCAENLNGQGECSALKICVKNGTRNLYTSRLFFSSTHIVPRETDQEVIDCLSQKIGNVIGANDYETSKAFVRERGYAGEYQAGSQVFSRVPLALVTRDEDQQWSSFVNWVVMATLYAEEQDITQATYASMPTTNLFGSNLPNMLTNAIRAVGSHDEILARNKGTYNVRSINRLNTNPYGPQHYAAPGLLWLF